jgi:membrane protease subunit HflK
VEVQEAYGAAGWVAAAVLAGLCVWSLVRGAARRGVRDLRDNLDATLRLIRGRSGSTRSRFLQRPGRRGWSGLVLLGLVLWGLSGFTTVGPGWRGYPFVFGEIADPLEPGIHWVPPRPFARVEHRWVGYARKGDIGFRTQLDLLDRRREIRLRANPAGWHSPVAAMNSDPERVTYLTADENFVEMSFSVHYGLADPEPFFYDTEEAWGLVVFTAEAVARELVAGRRIDDLLTRDRSVFESDLALRLQADLDALGLGVAVRSVHIVDIHPPEEAVFAFRDVSSAREDRETLEHRARATQARDIPRARGESALLLAVARAAAAAESTLAWGRASAFTLEAAATAPHRDLLEHLLRIESAERTLAGKEKFIVPPGATGGRITLWRDGADPGEKQ